MIVEPAGWAVDTRTGAVQPGRPYRLSSLPPPRPGGMAAHLVYLGVGDVPAGEDTRVRGRGAVLRVGRSAAGASHGLIALLVLLLLTHHLTMATMPMGSVVGQHAAPPATIHLAMTSGSPSAFFTEEATCTGCPMSCPLTRGSPPPRGPHAAPPPGANVRQAAPYPTETRIGARQRGDFAVPPSARARCAILQVFRI